MYTLHVLRAQNPPGIGQCKPHTRCAHTSVLSVRQKNALLLLHCWFSAPPLLLVFHLECSTHCTYAPNIRIADRTHQTPPSQHIHTHTHHEHIYTRFTKSLKRILLCAPNCLERPERDEGGSHCHTPLAASRCTEYVVTHIVSAFPVIKHGARVRQPHTHRHLSTFDHTAHVRPLRARI